MYGNEKSKIKNNEPSNLDEACKLIIESIPISQLLPWHLKFFKWEQRDKQNIFKVRNNGKY